MTNIISVLAELPDEPIISAENEALINQITNITKTSEFEPMNLEDPKLDELLDCLTESEGFNSEINSIINGLQRAPSIILLEEDEEDDYM